MARFESMARIVKKDENQQEVNILEDKLIEKMDTKKVVKKKVLKIVNLSVEPRFSVPRALIIWVLVYALIFFLYNHYGKKPEIGGKSPFLRRWLQRQVLGEEY